MGQDGFGFVPDPAGYVKVPQVGRVVIGDSCEVGANSTIDRGANRDTIIADGCWIDNLVQIGHNVELGQGCIIVAQVGISGSSEAVRLSLPWAARRGSRAISRSVPGPRSRR